MNNAIRYDNKTVRRQDRTAIIRLDIEWMSGKTKRINP